MSWSLCLRVNSVGFLFFALNVCLCVCLFVCLNVMLWLFVVLLVFVG